MYNTKEKKACGRSVRAPGRSGGEMRKYSKTERARYNTYLNRVCVELGITRAQYNHLRQIAQQRLHQRGPAETLKNKGIDYCSYLRLYIYFGEENDKKIYVDKKPIPADNYTRAMCIY